MRMVKYLFLIDEKRLLWGWRCSFKKSIFLHKQIAFGKNHGKLLRQVLAANDHGKFSRQIVMGDFHGKSSNNAEDDVQWSPLYRNFHAWKLKSKQQSVSLLKLYNVITPEIIKIRRSICKTKFVESNVALFTFLKLFLVENDWNVLYLQYQLFSYHPWKALDMPSCYVKTKPGYEHDKNILWTNYSISETLE